MDNDDEKFLRNRYDLEFLREIFNPEIKKVMILETYRGEIVIELFHKDVPLIKDVLIRVLLGKYNGITFHNCNPFFVQIRRNFKELEGKRRTVVPYLKNTRGHVGLVNSKSKPENSLLDHFYICLKDIPEFDEKYTVIGRVIKGLDVLNKIWDGNTVKNVRIEKDYDKKKIVGFKLNFLFWIGLFCSLVSLLRYLSTKIGFLEIAQEALFKRQITDLISANVSLFIIGVGIFLMLVSIIFAPIAKKHIERAVEPKAPSEPKKSITEEKIFPDETEEREEKIQPPEREAVKFKTEILEERGFLPSEKAKTQKISENVLKLEAVKKAGLEEKRAIMLERKRSEEEIRKAKIKSRIEGEKLAEERKRLNREKRRLAEERKVLEMEIKRRALEEQKLILMKQREEEGEKKKLEYLIKKVDQITQREKEKKKAPILIPTRLAGDLGKTRKNIEEYTRKKEEDRRNKEETRKIEQEKKKVEEQRRKLEIEMKGRAAEETKKIEEKRRKEEEKKEKLKFLINQAEGVMRREKEMKEVEEEKERIEVEEKKIEMEKIRQAEIIRKQGEAEEEQEKLKRIEKVRIEASLMREKEEAKRRAEEEEKRRKAEKIAMEESAKREAEADKRREAEAERKTREEAIKKKLEETRKAKEQQEKMKKLQILGIKSREIMQKERAEEEKRRKIHEEQERRLLAEQKKIEEERRKEKEIMMKQEEERRKIEAQKKEKEQREKMQKMKALEIKSTELFKKERSERENLRKEFVQKMDTEGGIREEIKKKGKEEIKAYILPKIAKRTETHLDVLFDLLEKYDILKISYIVQTFNIDKEEALEWCNILVEHGLAELDYPAFGEPTLRKKEPEPTPTET